MRKELKRFIRNGVSETLRYEKAFDVWRIKRLRDLLFVS
ncbi:hypothetical protein LINCOLNB_24 [Paenibacillus phage LincolnB]|uniref:Uncharacterized protein n=1 Tax=Paenibacillus phage LincolnB TaxID=2249769 RepID=A0A345ATU1_9CAUD|nr:hypothetical protein LINCOLNB_24 [Paenibacillus phage LincolnB]